MFYVFTFIIIPSTPLVWQHPVDKTSALPTPTLCFSQGTISGHKRALTPGHIIACLPSRKLKTVYAVEHKNVLQAACATGPVLEPGYRPWIPRPTLTRFNPSYSNNTIIKCFYILFHSPGYLWISSQDTVFHFFFSPRKVPWVVTMTGRLFSFCKNKRIHRDLGFHPEQVLIRKEVGHNEHKEFLSFVQELGSQQLRMKQSMWLVGLYWTGISPAG